jgi:hypothetical protein
MASRRLSIASACSSGWFGVLVRAYETVRIGAVAARSNVVAGAAARARRRRDQGGGRHGRVVSIFTGRVKSATI